MSIVVQFSNPHGVYYPGTEVCGTVILNLESSIKARSVCIFVDGRAHTHWTESESHTHRNADGTTRTETRTITYEASVIYASGEAVVWSDSPSADKLLPGQHQFPFRFFLPATCAPSFEGCYGYIRYQVSVEIDRKWRFNKTNRKFFTVAPTFDLNTIPQAIQPVKDSKCQNTGMVLFRHGKIMVEARISKMGFVPGEGIIIDCFVDNGSSRPVVNAEVKLNQVSKYMAARSGWSCHYSVGLHASQCGHRREEKKIVARGGKLIEVPPKSKATVQVEVAVPATVASFNTCPIISVEYYLSVKLCLKGSINNEVKNHLPILIGTIPVYNMIAVVQPGGPQPSAPYPTIGFNPSGPYQGNVYPPVSTSSVPSAPEDPSPPYPGGAAGSQGLPPSYEESVYGTAGTTKNTDNAEAFAPRYPVYHNLPPAPGFNPTAPALPEKS